MTRNRAVFPEPASMSMSTSAPAKTTWTILEVLKWTTQRFVDRGLASPRLDAELLAGHAFSLPRIALYTEFDRPLAPPELDRFRELVKRRQAGEPVAYLTGRKEFWKLDLAVDARVLIPRPDTETLIEATLELLGPKPPPDETQTLPPARRLLDVGTGSGAIALTLKHERPELEVFASDVSSEALAVAGTNAERLGLAVHFVQGHLLGPFEDTAPFDVIVANLPYVPRKDLAALSPEVRSEPVLALDGGPDGLDLVGELIAAAPARLVASGALLLEIGQGQAAAVVERCRAAGFAAVTTHRDLGGIERVVLARRAVPEGPA